MGKIINVRFLGSQDAEDLYVSVDSPRKVYVRHPANVDGVVFWLTSNKWQGGYEASAPIRADITMRVVDKKDKVLFEETLKPDFTNGDTSAEKKGPFSYEAIKELAANFEKEHGLKPHEAWRDFVLQDKEAFNNKDYNDNWLYWHVESLGKKVLGDAEVLGQKFYFVEEKMKHKISGKEWTSYDLMDEKKEITIALCGYEFDNVLTAERGNANKAEALVDKIAAAERSKAVVSKGVQAFVDAREER